MKRRLLSLLPLLALLPALALAQTGAKRPKPPQVQPDPEPVVEDKTVRDPRKYAVLSLLGDNVQLIHLTPSRGDTAQTGEWTAKPAGAVDNAALQTLDATIKVLMPDREVKLYTSSTRSLFGDPANLFVNGKLTLPGSLNDAVRQSGAARLLLVTRSRQDPGLAPTLPARILATLEGPGFVLDQRPSGQIGFDGQSGLPVLAAYASIRVALIDLSDMRLVREQSLAVASRLPVAREAVDNPWAATTGEQRLKALETLIETELPITVKTLLAP
jgi:hypothetical protein